MHTETYSERRAGSIWLRLGIGMLALSLSLLFAMQAEAVTIPYPKSYDASSLTGNPRKDMVTIATSQIGYKEVQENGNKYSYYAEYIGTGSGNWCTEFVSWCLLQSGLPKSLSGSKSNLKSKSSLVRYFGKQGRMYVLQGGSSKASAWQSDYVDSVQTITPNQIEPGDILLINRSSSSSSPSHTNMVSKVNLSSKKFVTIDGNSRGKGSSGVSSVRKVSTIKFSMVYAVIKPMYELYPLDGVKAWRLYDQSVAVRWSKREGVTGYLIYRSTKSSTKLSSMEPIGKVTDVNILSYADKTAKADTVYYYKVVPYITNANGKTYDGSGFNFSYTKADVNGGTTVKVDSSTCSHVYQTKITDAGTCKTMNTVVYTCRFCGDSYTQHERLGDHVYVKKSDTKPTANAPGKRKYVCSVCGTSYTEEYEAGTFTVGKIKYTVTDDGYVEVSGGSSKNARSVVIPAAVKYNGKNYTVTTIAAKAFRKYKKLKTVVIQAAVTEIGSQAFYGCTKLRTITINASEVPQLGSKVFKSIYKKAVFKVPAASVSAYEKAFKKKKAGFWKTKMKVQSL